MSVAETCGAVIATIAGLTAIVLDYGDAGGVAVAGIAAAVTVGTAVLLFAGAVPRAKARGGAGDRAAETALVTSAVGFASVASAWTGLPFVLGAGGAMLGRAAHDHPEAPTKRGLAKVAVALGLSAVALGAVAVTAV